MLRTGRVGRSVLQDQLGFTYPRFRRAVELAGRCEWIVAGRALSPGTVAPPAGTAPDAPVGSWTATSAPPPAAELSAY